MLLWLPCRLKLGDKLTLACSEKKGRSKPTEVNGVVRILPTGEGWLFQFGWFQMTKCHCPVSELLGSCCVQLCQCVLSNAN